MIRIIWVLWCCFKHFKTEISWVNVTLTPAWPSYYITTVYHILYIYYTYTGKLVYYTPYIIYIPPIYTVYIWIQWSLRFGPWGQSYAYSHFERDLHRMLINNNAKRITGYSPLTWHIAQLSSIRQSSSKLNPSTFSMYSLKRPWT